MTQEVKKLIVFMNDFEKTMEFDVNIRSITSYRYQILFQIYYKKEPTTKSTENQGIHLVMVVDINRSIKIIR